MERFHNFEEIEFKREFIERYSKLTDFETFKKYSLSFLRKAIRVNTLKYSAKELKQELTGWTLEEIPWCKTGFWIKGERRDIGNLPQHILGKIYVQEAASMIPPEVLQPEEGDLVLDLCSAPGSKTTQMAAMMKNEGLIVANDIIPSRLEALKINMQRCGVENSLITQMRSEKIRQKGIFFDKILLDAPCSGTGTIRKSPKTINMWNPKTIKKISKLQKTLIIDAFNLLKKGGILVYSTCTLEPEENEEVIDYLLKNFADAKIEDIDIKIKRSNAITEFEGKKYSEDVKKTLRIFPQDNDTEGFYVAKIRKI